MDLADVEEPQEVREYPGQSRVPRLSETGDSGGIDFGLEARPDGLEVVDRVLCEWACWRLRCGRELVPAVVPQGPALDRVQLGNTVVGLNPVRRLHLDNRPITVSPLQLDIGIRPSAVGRFRPGNILLRLNSGGRFRPGNIGIRPSAVGRFRLGHIVIHLNTVGRLRPSHIGIRPDRRRRSTGRGRLDLVAARTGCGQEYEPDQKNTEAERVHASTLRAQARAMVELHPERVGFSPARGLRRRCVSNPIPEAVTPPNASRVPARFRRATLPGAMGYSGRRGRTADQK